jgi:hypothetical protein
VNLHGARFGFLWELSFVGNQHFKKTDFFRILRGERHDSNRFRHLVVRVIGDNDNRSCFLNLRASRLIVSIGNCLLERAFAVGPATESGSESGLILFSGL